MSFTVNYYTKGGHVLKSEIKSTGTGNHSAGTQTLSDAEKIVTELLAGETLRIETDRMILCFPRESIEGYEIIDRMARGHIV